MSKFVTHTPITEKDVYLLTVEGDTNDGDYTEQSSTVTLAELEDNVLAFYYLFNGDIKGWGELSDRNSVNLSDDITECLWDYIPSSGYGLHDIEVISFQYIDTDGVLHDAHFNTSDFKKNNPELFI